MTSCPHCGSDIDAKPKWKPRSVPQHRRYFALIRSAFAHWPETHRFRPTSEEHLRKWLQAKAGYHNIRTIDTTRMEKADAIVAIAAELAAADPIHFTSITNGKFHIIESKSIDFDTLPHLAACALFDAVAETIEAETGLQVADIMPPLRQQASLKREMFAEVPL